MLCLKNISKQYRTGELIQQALNNVSLRLRDNEFVSILAPVVRGRPRCSISLADLTVTTAGS